MFYSQIILAKKGPLSQLWLAAHFQDKKLTRPQIFATDIASSVDSITNPQVPLALRVSGHLLLGVVRIYSKKVHYLWQDCHQAMVQIQMAFVVQQQPNNSATAIDMDHAGGREKTIMSGRRRRTRDTSNDEEMDERAVANLLVPTATLQGFGIPFDLNDDSMENAQDWVPAEIDNEDDEEGQAAVLGLSSASPDRRNLAREAADLTLNETMLETTLLTQPQEEEQWTAFDPTDGDDAMPMPDDEEDAMPMPMPDDDEPANAADTSSLQAEAPRANESVTSDLGVRIIARILVVSFVPDDYLTCPISCHCNSLDDPRYLVMLNRGWTVVLECPRPNSRCHKMSAAFPKWTMTMVHRLLDVLPVLLWINHPLVGKMTVLRRQ